MKPFFLRGFVKFEEVFFDEKKGMVVQMATATSGASSKWLWKAIYKINHDQLGTSFACWIADKTLADARLAAEAIGAYALEVLPIDAEIYEGRLHRWDLKRNAWALNNVVGPGIWGTQLAVPLGDTCDSPYTSLEVRFENAEGEPVPRKWSLIPDLPAKSGLITTPPSNQVGAVVGLPVAPAVTVDWRVKINHLIKLMMFYTHHVKKDPIPAGLYEYFPWENVYFEELGVKKGGHVFIG